MASITLTGNVKNPTSELSIGSKVRFVQNSATGETLPGAVSIVTIGPAGTYSVNLQYGLVLVEYKDVTSTVFKKLGVATVNASNTATSIPELMNALVPVSSPELIEFQAILANAVSAKEAAEAAAATTATRKATFAEIEALSPTIDGITFICQERFSAEYILQAAAYTALPGDATFANNRVGKLQKSGTVKFSKFGAVVGTDAATAFNLYVTSSCDLLDLEGKTWIAPSLDCDNATTRAALKNKVFNGTLETTNSLSHTTKIQNQTVTKEDAAPLVDTKSPILNWAGKKILWLGTSIPHQGVGADGYPERFGEILQSTVYNWAWSGSHAFYDIAGASDQSGTIRALSMTEADRLAGLALYGAGSAYDDSFNNVTVASQMTADYRIEAQFVANAMDVVMLDHNHNDRKNDATYTANDKTITGVTVGSTTVFAVNNITGLAVGNGCYVRVTGIAKLDYMAGRISAVSGSNVTVAFNSTGFAGTFSAGTLHFVDRNTIQGSFDFLIAYTKNSSIRNGSGDVKIILCNSPSYFTNNADRDFGIWHVGRAIKAVADTWGLSYFDVAHALRITYHDHQTYLPDDVHPTTPETKAVLANYWTQWAAGGKSETYNSELALQRNAAISQGNNYPALYSRHDNQYAARSTTYSAGTDVINDDFSGNLSAWTQIGSAPTIVNAPWGGGEKAVEFDATTANAGQTLVQAAAVGRRPLLDLDFYITDATIASGVSNQMTFAQIEDASGGGGYALGLIQSIGGDIRLSARYFGSGFGVAPLSSLPFTTYAISANTKYNIVFDIVDGYAYFEVNGVKLYAGKIANSLLVAPAQVAIGTVFSNTGTDYNFYIGNVIAKSKYIIDLYSSGSITAPLHIATFDALELLNPTQTGQVFICDGRAGAKYILGAVGTVALSGDATCANSRVLVLQYKNNANIKWWGAISLTDGVLVDSTVAVQAAFTRFKNPNLAIIPIATGDRDRLIKGVALNLAGGVYLISDYVDYSSCHGIHVKSGTFIADATSTNFTSPQKAMINNDISFTISPRFENLTFECNGVTNGLRLERCIYGNVEGCRFWGFGNQAYGAFAGSNFAGFTTNVYFDNNKFFGTIAAQGIPNPTATGIGLIVTDSDCEVTGGETSRCFIGIKTTTATQIRGVHLTGNDGDNAIGILKESKTRVRITDCYFDNTILVTHPRETIIAHNEFKTINTPTNAYPIVLKSINADDDMFDCVISDNQAKMTNATGFIGLDETNGAFLDMGQAKVTDNICRNAAGGAPYPTQLTAGQIIVDVATASFNGLAVEVDLSNTLLFSDCTLADFTGSVTASPTTFTATPYCKGMRYIPATGILTVLFSEQFTGKFAINCEWGTQGVELTATLPSNPIVSGHPAYSAYLNANQSNVTGNGTVYAVPIATERFDYSSIYDTTNKKAIIKVDGLYDIDYQVMIDGLTTATAILMKVTAGSSVFEDRRAGTFTGQFTLNCSGLVELQKDDEITVTVTVTGSGSDNVDVNGSGASRTYASGVLQA